MRQALTNLNDDLTQQYADYVCRVTSEEGDIGRGHLGRFQELETTTPVILTTSQLLTTGVDAPTCKNIVLARVVNSMTEFKQMIGRGTRVRDDYGKLYFNILDYTGSATRLFADPDFDGDPVLITQEEMTETGEPKAYKIVEEQPVIAEEQGEFQISDDREGERRKYYFDGGQVEIVAHIVHELDPDGKQLRAQWADPEQRAEIIQRLAERGIDFDDLAKASGQPEADPFDLLCHVAFNAPLRTRRERADRLRREKKDFFDQYGPKAKEILTELLEKYAEYGTAQFVIPDVLKIPPLSERGNVMEIAGFFGGPEQLRTAVNQLQTLLYAA